jgi:hypothetical protein
MKAVDNDAKRAVLLWYAEAFDLWAEEEHRLLDEGKVVEAQGAHEMGLVVLRAYHAESDDPAPRRAR